MLTAAKMQKELRAWREVVPPKAKARQFVREVTVMAGPACPRASWIRFWLLSFRLV